MYPLRPVSIPDGIRFNTWLPLSADHSWTVITRAEHLRGWLGEHIALDATPGGFFREHSEREGRKVVITGRMLRLERPRLMIMTWSDQDWGVETEVEIRLTGLADGSLLTLNHSGWTGLSAQTAEAVRRDHEIAWKRHLTDLEAYCSTIAAERPTALAC